MSSSLCRVCGLELVDLDSVEKGIGPKCHANIQRIRELKPEPSIASEQSTLKPSSITVMDRFRKQSGDLSMLCNSITKVGLLHPLVVTHGGVLVAGQRRLIAWRLLYGRNNTITPTDIDGLIEYQNKAYVIIETKYGEKTLPDGQRKALETLTRDLSQQGKPTICIIAEHNIHDVNKPVIVADTPVRKYKHNNRPWHDYVVTVKQLIDNFLGNTEQKHSRQQFNNIFQRAIQLPGGKSI